MSAKHFPVCTRKSPLKPRFRRNERPRSMYPRRHRIQLPVQLTATMWCFNYPTPPCRMSVFFSRAWSLDCANGGGEMSKRVKEGSSVSAGSLPPTGALCMKSVGFRTLSSHTSKGDSINYISQRALRQRTRQQTRRDRG